MKNGNILSKKDYEDIELLKGITNSIDRLYHDIYELELENKINSSEFLQKIDYLTIALEVEANKYENMNLTKDRCLAVGSYIFEEVFLLPNKSNIELILSGEKSNRRTIRILSVLRHKMNREANEDDKVLKKIYAKARQLGVYHSREMIEKSWNIASELSSAFRDESFILFLSFIEEIIHYRKNIDFIPELTKAKYDFAFTNNKMESEMMKNQFNVFPSLFLNSKIIADLLGVQTKLYKLIKNDYGMNIVNSQINELLAISDLNFKNKDKTISGLLRQAYLRVGLLFMLDDAIMEANSIFHEYIDTDDYARISNDYQISEKMIIDSFKRIKKDREKHLNLSLVRD